MSSIDDPAPLRIAVTGQDGQLVRSLRERGPGHGVTVVALGRPALDLARPASLEALRGVAPDVIVNAAAYTAVDKAEAEDALAQTINGEGAGAVARIASDLGVPVIQISTDYVFDGSGKNRYREEDIVAPLGSYGRAKLAGERLVAAATPDHAILRTSWVYSPFGSNFVKTMLRVAATRDEVAVVADQHGCPTYAPDLADGILQVARNLAEQPRRADLRGVFHMAGSGSTTWFAFAEAVFALSAAHGGPTAQVRAIATADYPTAARRPANSRLDGAKLAGLHGVALPDWRTSLPSCVERILEERVR